MDLIAKELGLEPAEVRARNMIPAAEMPYRAGIPYRDGEPIVYDSGDYPGGLEKALAAVGGVDGLPQAPGRGAQGGTPSRARHRLLCRGHRRRAVRERAGAHRSVRQDLRRVGRLPAGAGHGDDLRPDRRRHLEGRSRQRHRGARRHLGDRDRLRHDREPLDRDAVGRDPLRERAAAREGVRHRGQHAGMLARRPRAARRRRRPRRRAGRVGAAGQDRGGGAAGLGSRAAGRDRCRAREHVLLRAGDGHLGLCDACRGGRRRRRDRRRDDRAIRDRARLRHGGQPDAGRRAGGRRRRAGDRRRAARGVRLRPRRQSDDRLARRLPACRPRATCRRCGWCTRSRRRRSTRSASRALGEGGAIAPPVAIANAVADALAPYGAEFNATPVRPEQVVRAVAGK